MELRKNGLVILIVVLLLFLAACGNSQDPTDNGSGNEITEEETGSESENALADGGEAQMLLAGMIEIDGSSTVFPITEAVAEEFGKMNSGVRVPVGVSGTGGGFKRFCAGETAINNASRVIKDEEKTLCESNVIDYIELAVAYDGLSVLVNKENDFVDKLTVDELKAIFQSGSKAVTWNDVRADWPKEKIVMFSPGTDSGTFDYFTEVINGEVKAIRNDTQISFSEDDNALVQGIAGDKYAIGYFGFAYYEENKDRLKLVPIDNGKGPILPNETTINDGTYAPLSRPLYIYVSKDHLLDMEVYEFVNYYIEQAPTLAEEVGYIALPEEMYAKDMELLLE
ncbi:PstS family phosphate ABC transporter substrate-binding protein [Paenibacillus harenae]|uniref:PstS family phosphate ABC transporter substrate-binding protein n=1 Tax=Paenibacillus harenae TaxID=306543 RepID=UPI00041F4261